MAKVKTTEYRIAPLDEYGDQLKVFYFDTKAEAKRYFPEIKDEYPVDDYLIEKNTRVYQDDGELLDDQYEEVRL